MSNPNAIAILQEKVERIISDNKSLRSQLQKVTGERDKLAQKHQRTEIEVSALEKRVKILETAASFAGGGSDQKSARQRVNRLLREIDSCIALIHKA